MSLLCLTRPRRKLIVDAARVRKFDPTGTTKLRQRYEADLVRRFRQLRALITEAIVKLDVLGLKPQQSLESSLHSQMFARMFAPRDAMTRDAPPQPKAFAFNRPSDKVESFMEWLYGAQQEGVLGIIQGTPVRAAAQQAWQNTYIDTAYQKGIRDAGSKMRDAGVEGVDQQWISTAFNRPVHADRLGLIHTRAYSELEGITDTMSAQISRVLAQGIGEGLGPQQIARDLTDRVDAIGITRARVLARTETISAHAEASLNSYEEAGLEGVEVEAEFTTAGDEAVCPECEEMEGKTFPISEAHGMIPLHPNCRCAFLPVVGEVTEDAASVVDEWNEEDHPREEDGRFTESGGGGGSGGGSSGESSNLSSSDPQLSRPLSNREFSSVQTFIGEGPYDNAIGINHALRTGERLTERQAETVRGLSSAIDKAKPTDEPMVLYRGIESDQLQVAGPGSYTRRDPGFTSVTTSRAVAEEFATMTSREDVGFVYRIHAPAGIKALDVSLYQGHTMSYQKELILPRGAKFERTGKSQPREGITLVDLIYIPPA